MNNPQLATLADKILEKIRLRPGHSFELSKLSHGLKVGKEDIIGALRLLQTLGYAVTSDGKGHLILASAPDSLLEMELSYRLKTKFIGKQIHAYKSVQSTNVIANQLAASGAPEGTIVVAERQTKGRGRLGRSWHSPEKVGLYCSIILRPKVHPTLAPGISLMTALALADTIASYDRIEVKIKWPNDVLIAGKKTAGILTELSAEIDRTVYVIVGVGININQKKSDFLEELKKSATSIRIELNKEISRVDFAQRFLRNFEKEYVGFKRHGLARLRNRILKYSSLLNTIIKLRIGRKIVSGNVLDIDERGQLVIQTDDGIKAYNAGEVTTH